MATSVRSAPRTGSSGGRPLTIRFVIAPSPRRSWYRGAASANGRSGALPERALFALATLALASLLLAVFAFVQPAYTSLSDDVAYEQRGTFSYTAAAPPGVYDRGDARTGDTLFRRLTDRVAIRFDYQIAADRLSSLAGSYRLVADVADGQGWSRSITLQPDTTFSGASFSAAGTVDLAQVQRLIDGFERRTGVRRQRYTLSIMPTITVQGALAGQDLRDTFAPRLAFQFDALELQPVKDGASDLFDQVQKGLVKRSRVEPNTLALLGLKLPVDLARRLALIGLIAGVGALSVLGWRMAHDTRADPMALIRLKHGGLLIDVRRLDLAEHAHVVEVASIDDLAKLAERAGQMILHETRGNQHHCAVQSGDVTYHCQVEPAADPKPGAMVSRS